MKEKPLLRIGEVARQTGLHATTIRRLEQRGLLPPPRRDWAGHRRFAPDDLDRLRALMFPARGESPGHRAEA